MKLTPNMRANLFIWGCIPTRLYLAWIPQEMPQYLRHIGLIVSIMSLGTLYLAFTGNRMNAAEGGMKTWWAPFRYIHGALLAIAAIMLLNNDSNASIPLGIDVIIGILTFFIKRLGLPN